MPRKLCKDNMLYFTRLSTLPNGINGKLEMTKVINTFEADYDVKTISFTRMNY